MTITAYEPYLLDLINADRTSRGLTPYVGDLELDAAADRHTANMINLDYFQHTDPDGTTASQRVTQAGYGWTSTGENIAWRTYGSTFDAADVQAIHTQLMNSSGHYANLMSGNFKEVGLGLSTGEFQGRQVLMLTENFGRPNTAEAAETDKFGSSTPPPSTTPTAGNDSIVGTDGDDGIDPLAGNDVVDARGGNDTLFFSPGVDTFTGGAGSDGYWFRAVADSPVSAPDTITDFVGHYDYFKVDSLEAAIGHDLFWDGATAGQPWGVWRTSTGQLRIDATGDGAADIAVVLQGSPALDETDFHGSLDVRPTPPPGQTITGTAGSDTLTGGDGNDLIIGNGSTDTMTGGLGRDVFRFAFLDGGQYEPHDVITDFVVGTDDLDLPGAILATESTTDGTYIKYGPDGTTSHSWLFLTGVHNPDLALL